MTTMGNAIKKIGTVSKSQELSKNLLIWHAWAYEEVTISDDGYVEKIPFICLAVFCLAC